MRAVWRRRKEYYLPDNRIERPGYAVCRTSRAHGMEGDSNVDLAGDDAGEAGPGEGQGESGGEGGGCSGQARVMCW